MGLFSRLVLGFPTTLISFSSNVQNTSENHRFPDGGARTSLRFIPAPRLMQKRRRKLANGETKEDEIFSSENNCETTCFEFIGEVLDQSDNTHNERFRQVL